MKKSTKNELRSIELARNHARDALYRVKAENEHEWKLARKLKRVYEKLFVSLWRKFSVDPKYVEKEFFECCDYLVEFITEEQRAEKEFKKTYKPFYDNLQKLDKEYHRIKSQQTKKQRKKK